MIQQPFSGVKHHQKSSTSSKFGGEGEISGNVPKKSNDHVFESKKVEYYDKVNSIDAEVSKLTHKMDEIRAEINYLEKNDEQSLAREELNNRIMGLKTKKSDLQALRLPILKKLTDTQDILKLKQGDLSASKEKSAFRRPEDALRKISEMEHEVESGQLKLIDEKRMVAEISKLRKAMKSMDGIKDQENFIVNLKTTIDQYRTTLNEKDREIRVYDEQIRAAQNELGKLSMTKNSVQKKINALNGEMEKLRLAMEALYEKKYEAYVLFQDVRKAHMQWIEKDQLRREEESLRRNLEYTIRQLELEMKNLDIPPCAEQISQCINLQNHLRANVLQESHVIDTAASEGNVSCLPPLALRQVTSPTDLQVLEKPEDALDSFYVSLAHKKTYKKRNSPRTLPSGSIEPSFSATAKLKLPFWVVSGLEALNVPIVANIEEAREAIAKLASIQSDFEKEQIENFSSIDKKKSDLQSRLDALQTDLLSVPEEAAKRVALNQAKYLAERKKNSPNYHDGSRVPASLQTDSRTHQKPSKDRALEPSAVFPNISVSN